MLFDISGLTETELIQLNQQVVARIKMLRSMQTQSDMLQFRPGERVAFQPVGMPMQQGVLTRFNQKTVTILTDDGSRWNVSPALLQRISPGGTSNDNSPDDNEDGKILELFK